jgi:FKBP-type peptidyl-prolyl cis-trans isomerase 2
MATAKNGDNVKVDYVGKLKDGSVFDTSDGRDPLQFKLGSGKIIPGFEEAVIGMNTGESKTVDIPAKSAYGPVVKELIHNVDRSQIPSNIELKKGQNLQMQTQDGQSVIVTVKDFSDDTVILDANHPLAGKDLIFEIKLLEIE